MRIDRLSLSHYGAFDSRVLDLSQANGLAIVYGPNEAGKSTCLMAALDLLFGIPHASRHGGQFGYDKMLLEGTLRRSSGELLQLRRRKGRAGRTLTSADGNTFDEQTLAELLGAFDRERYAGLFALDHALLRSGGEALLSSNGEIGRLIVEAGGGLSQLMPLLDVLDSQADALYAPRASRDRAFYKSLARLEVARKGIRENTLTREQFDDAEGRVRALEAQLAALRSGQRLLREQIAEAERLLRVGPLLIEFAELERDLAAEQERNLPGRDFASRVRVALAAEQRAEEAMRAAELDLARANEQVERVTVDRALLAEEPALAVLEERRARLSVLKEGEAALRQELHGVEALLVRSEGIVAFEAVVGDERARRSALDSLEPSALRIAGLRDQERLLLLRIAEDEAEEAQLNGLEARAVESGVDRPWAVDVAPLTELVHAEGQRARTEGRLSALRTQHQRAVSALGFTDITELRSLLLPDVQVTRAAVDAERRSDERLLNLEGGLADLKRRHYGADQRLRQLVTDFALPAPQELGEIRAKRDAVWGALRDEYYTLQPPLQPLLARAARTERAERFEELFREADGVADVLASAAQTVAEVRVIEREQLQTSHDIEEIERRIADERATREERRGALFRGFEPASLRAGDAVALLALLDRRAELDREASELSRLEEEYALEAARVSPSLELLAHCEELLRFAPASEPLSARVARVFARVRAHEAAHAEYESARDNHGSRAPERARRRAEARAQHEERTVAERTFYEALGALGLPTQTQPDQASRLVHAARERERASRDKQRLTLELAQIAEAERELAVTLQSLRAFLPDDGAREAPAAFAVLLRTRLARTQAAAERRSALEEQRASADMELGRRRETHTRAQGVCAELAREASVDTPRLAATADGTERVYLLRDKRDALRLRTAQAGDGYPVEVLRARLAERDAAALRAEIATDHDELTLCAHKLETTLLELAQAETALARFGGGTSLNEHQASREAAVAELASTVEQYLTLRLSRELLTRAVADVRQRQRDPLVTRASMLFAAATEGAFRGLETEVSRQDEPVVFGVRAGGAAVPLAEMSDGTRDQLFLAFRLASVEHYCSVREPLPFIGDDLLVHFDDVRSRATLNLLAEFAQTTQVLLFTHHESVCALAHELVAQGRAQILTLSSES